MTHRALHSSLRHDKCRDDQQDARWKEATDDVRSATIDCRTGNLVPSPSRISFMPPHDPLAQSNCLDVFSREPILRHFFVRVRADPVLLLVNRLSEPLE
jgi:hypothetical protein